MDRQTLWLWGLGGCLIANVIAVRLFLNSSPPAPQATPPVGQKAEPPHAQPQEETSAAEPPPLSPSQHDLPKPQASPTDGKQARGAWDDPSLEPSMKGEPPTPFLPPDARPTEPNIEPPEEYWRGLRKQGDAITY